MNNHQKLSPKYWVCHDKRDSDVYLFSARKSREDCCKVMEETYGEDWFMEDNFEIILVEILEVSK